VEILGRQRHKHHWADHGDRGAQVHQLPRSGVALAAFSVSASFVAL